MTDTRKTDDEIWDEVTADIFASGKISAVKALREFKRRAKERDEGIKASTPLGAVKVVIAAGSKAHRLWGEALRLAPTANLSPEVQRKMAAALGKIEAANTMAKLYRDSLS